MGRQARSVNYQQAETSSNLQSREDRLKQLEEKLNATASERRAAKQAAEEAKRRAKYEEAAGKLDAMNTGQHFAGNSHAVGEDEETTKEQIEQAERLRKQRAAARAAKSLRDDGYNPLGGNESSGARYRN